VIWRLVLVRSTLPVLRKDVAQNCLKLLRCGIAGQCRRRGLRQIVTAWFGCPGCLPMPASPFAAVPPWTRFGAPSGSVLRDVGFVIGAGLAAGYRLRIAARFMAFDLRALAVCRA